ncbi:MAG: MliC family protein [Alphaproteobacteria bacterium]|nr:MliC family protein [Alphaproteobacteria bacterium]
MNKVIFVFVIALALVSCGKTDKNAVTCGDYEVRMSINDAGDEMTAVINGDELILTLMPSASGARYVGILNDTTVTLWSKGRDWTMFLNDEDAILCK